MLVFHIDGSFQDITISGFTGGNGSYLASTTTYDSPSNAFSGSFEAVSGSKFYNNQPGNSVRYIVLKDTEGRSVLKSINADCATRLTRALPDWIKRAIKSPYFVGTIGL